MNDDTQQPTEQRGWLERLSQALLREPQDRAQLLELLRDATTRAVLDADALAMIEGVLAVSVIQVRDIMIPRAQMVVINEDASLADILAITTESGHSRFPVIGDNHDEVIGILLAKDLLKYTRAPQPEFFLHDLLRPSLLIPESKRLDKLLQDFRRNRQHMAIIVDEYGGVSGLVTIEDVLEQIVGDIEDEYDIEEDGYIKKQTNNLYTIKALMPIEEFNQYFSATLEEDDFDTVGGLVLNAFGHMPKHGEAVSINQYLFKVLQADNRRLHLLQLSLLEPIDSDNTQVTAE